MKFFKCKHCGNIISFVTENNSEIICCGEKMEEIIPGTVEASKEKHIPVYKVNGNLVTVTVGSVEHPMTSEHLIEWVALRTKFGNQRKVLKAGIAPKVTFAICEGDEVEEVFAYCNLHGLWKASK